MRARNIARADSNDAVPSTGTRSNEASSRNRGPPLRVGGLPGRHRYPAGEGGERGIRLDGRVAERREPPLHGRQLTGLKGRQDQLGHQLDAPVPLGGVQQMLHGHRRRPVGLVPVGGTQVQLRDDVRLDPAELTKQELPEQGVVAVPLAPTVQRDQEQARRLEVAKPRLRAGLVESASQSGAHSWSRTAVRRRNRWTPSGSWHQRLAVQVVRHIPIVTQRSSTRRRRCHSRSQQRGTGRPATPRCARSPPPPAQRVRVTWACEKICSAPAASRARSLDPELQRLTRGPQPRQVRLLGATRGDELRTGRDPRDHHAEHIVAGRGPQFVKVVEHEHERGAAGPERRGQTGRGAAQGRHAQTAHICDQVGVAGEMRAYADASRVSRAEGSSSKRSSDTHATRRSSRSAHSASRVDLP